MDTGEGHFDMLGGEQTERLKRLYAHRVFGVGEEVTVKGSRFRVEAIHEAGLRLKLLPAKVTEASIELGMPVKDTVSGFEGVATARSEYLWDCVRIQVSATKLKPDGSRLDAEWFDEAQLRPCRVEVLPQEAGKVAQPPGGPDRPVAPRRDP
jgi:hypothetical protein